MTTDWGKVVQDFTGKGFLRITVINKSFQTLMASAAEAVASAWKNEKGELINENQELKNDWTKLKDDSFKFYKKRWSKVGQDNSKEKMTLKGQGSPGPKGENTMFVRDVDSAYIVATCMVLPPMTEAKKGKEHAFKNLGTALGAFEDILNSHELLDD